MEFYTMGKKRKSQAETKGTGSFLQTNDEKTPVMTMKKNKAGYRVSTVWLGWNKNVEVGEKSRV